MSTVLITGYEPFGEHQTNPSARVAQALDETEFDDATVIGRVLPVVFDEALPAVRGYISEYEPDAIISTGLMPDRAALTVERVGINVRDYDGVPDNDGGTPVDSPIEPDGPDAYFATLPIRALVEEIKQAGAPARISNTAGTHLCNNILYATRHYVETTDRSTRSGFVHVPFSHEQVARRDEIAPSMSLDAMCKGVKAAVRYLTEHDLE